MAFIVGTAGHVDHGKTSLVKALTGQDTDRLKEEQERGISIELGFAHLDLSDGTRAGVVDVPGHERFIRTMLAGAHGMDLVLFTVAADDGVMPQTVEHLDILHLLGVTRAIFVITKTDLASTGRVAEVEAQIKRLTDGTFLEGSPMVRYSFITNEGLDTIRGEIGKALGRIDTARPPGYFRLPVDRVFVLQGHGVVVTGTALQGEIRTGDRVRRLPGGELLRIRSVQVHGQPVSTATAGQRVALNLAALQKMSVERGDVLCDPRLTTTSDRFDGSLEVRPTAGPLRSHQRVRVHIGTAAAFGKFVLLGTQDSVPPGHRAFCQIVLSEPLPVLRGDHFVLRDETAQRTLGGGLVLHPWPRSHRRHEPQLEARLHSLQVGEPAVIAELFLQERDDFASASAALHQFLNLPAEETAARLRSATGIKAVSVDGEDFLTTARKWDAFKEGLIRALEAFHATHPLESGRDMEALREQLLPSVPPKVFRAVIDLLAMERVVAREGSLLRLSSHQVSLSNEDRQIADQVTRLLALHPLAPADVAQLARDVNVGRDRLTQVLRALERDHAVVRVAPDLYFLSSSIQEVKRIVRDELSDRDEISPAMFRDHLGITRKHAIPLLEYLDREGVTVRVGSARRVRSSRTTA